MTDFCIIFDLDGTLIDSRQDLTNAVNMVRQEFGLDPLGLEQVVACVGNGARKLIQRAFDGCDVDLEKAHELMKDAYARNLCNATILYPGVADGLNTLHERGIPLAVITNKPLEPTREIVRILKIADYFDYVIGGGSGFALKSDPESLNYVVKQSGSDPAKSWILGDNYTDLESGRRAGIKRGFARYGFGDPRNEQFDLAVDSFSEFVNYFTVN